MKGMLDTEGPGGKWKDRKAKDAAAAAKDAAAEGGGAPGSPTPGGGDGVGSGGGGDEGGGGEEGTPKNPRRLASTGRLASMRSQAKSNGVQVTTLNRVQSVQVKMTSSPFRSPALPGRVTRSEVLNLFGGGHDGRSWTMIRRRTECGVWSLAVLFLALG
jgi:hypothetical protein